MLTAPDLDVSGDALLQNGYEVLSELGQGSFAHVYMGRQRSTGQLVALKVLRGACVGDGEELRSRVESFRQEMQLCAALSHPNIVQLIDSGEVADGALYAAFAFVPGTTLKEVLSAEGKLGVAEAVHLMAQVLDALSCAHGRAIVHGDLKPENIMITRTGVRRNAMVLDFGLGRIASGPSAGLSADGLAVPEVLGTVCYAAPEQLRGEPPSPRCDLYSFGITLLECLTGDVPFHGASTREVILKQLGPEPVALPQWLRDHPLGRVLEIVTAKRPEKRDVPIERLLHMLTLGGVDGLSNVSGAPSDAVSADRERRQLTVVCCRLTISPDRSRAVDIEELSVALHTHYAALTEQAKQAGGVVATILADRMLIMFGYPHAREGDARRAARFALNVVAGATGAPSASGLDIRVAVHTGVVLIRNLRDGSAQQAHELTGLTPQMASQLVDRAASGEVVVSAETNRLLRRDFELEAVDETAKRDSPPCFRLVRERRGAASAEGAVGQPNTLLVGREPQLQQLLAGWAKASVGRSAVTLIIGEPGIGKSRLLQELRQHVGLDAWVELACAPESQPAPLRPVIDALQTMEQSIESLLTRVGLDLAENLPLLAALLSIPLNERYEPLHLSPERQRELTLQALVGLIVKLAEPRPIVLAIENLHWADPTTLELATLLIQTLRTTRSRDGGTGPQLYVVVTTRPEFIPQWTGDDVAFLPLTRLTPKDVEQMVTAGLSERHALPAELVEEVAQRAEGIPLFVEEITHVIVAAQAEAVGPAGVVADIPASIRDLLTARLDGVSAAAHDTAQLAAVLGREFRYELLQAVSPKDAAFLQQDVAELGRAGLVLHRRSGAHEQYLFRHVLLRDAAYDAMPRSTRQGLHLRVAHVLQHTFPEVEQQRPEIMALHYEQGGESLSAAEYWRRAGDQALRQAAYEATILQAHRGLTLLQNVQETPDRTRVEVETLSTLGTAFLMTKGYAAEEVERTFSQAWGLCERLGENVPVKVLSGIWGVQINRSNREAVDKLIPQVRRLATHTDDAVSALSGYSMVAVDAFWRGNFREAYEHARKGREFYDTDVFERFKREYGYDGGLYLHAFEMCALWQLGYADQAEALRRETLAVAERSRNPYSIAIAAAYSSAVSHDRGDPDETLEMADRMTALATEHHIYMWLATAACARGGAFLQKGLLDDAIANIQQGIGLYQGFGVFSSCAYYMTYLAEAYLAGGRASDGLEAADQGLSLCSTLVARFHESELLRLKGELLLLQEDAVTAEACLRHALDVARQHEGKSFELRAAMSLSRLLRKQGKRDEARAVLGGVYAWFTEGFETKDLREAKGLLAELA